MFGSASDNGSMKESSETERMKWRRVRARKKLGREAVPFRQPGRPPHGVEDSPYLADGTLPVWAEWFVYGLDQLPFEPDPGKRQEIAALRACVKSYGRMFEAEAEARAESEAGWREPRCKICKGPIRPDNRYGVCQRNPACKRESRRRYDRAHRN
jgi:hypothetical protein